MNGGFWAGLFGWIFGEEEKEEEREDGLFCESCGKEIPEEEHGEFNGLCKECFEK